LDDWNKTLHLAHIESAVDQLPNSHDLDILKQGDRIAASTPDPEFRRILVEHGMRIVAGCAEKLGEEELRALRARQAVLESFTAISQP